MISGQLLGGRCILIKPDLSLTNLKANLKIDLLVHTLCTPIPAIQKRKPYLERINHKLYKSISGSVEYVEYIYSTKLEISLFYF